MSATHWKARRLATRAKKVVARHADKPAIGAFEAPITAKADAFIESYDAAARNEAEWRHELQQGRDGMSDLQRTMESWKPHIARERPGFDLTTIGDRPTVPEDLFQDAHALADELDAVRAADGTTPPWASAAAVLLRNMADIAEREADEAARANATHSERLATVRANKAAFDTELSLLRDTLRATIGRTHPDFQKLRAEKASALDEEDDPTAPQPSGPVTPSETPPVPPA
jgi:hypothetical protein